MLKSALFACTLSFLIACQPASEKSPNIEVEDSPLLTLSELLAASDIQIALSDAAANKDKESLANIQSVLLEAAAEVNLDKNELSLISGPNGIVFLEFQGMRINFNREFETAFFSFGDIEAVYNKYPAFVDLKAKTQGLVENRNNLIQSIQNDLESRGVEPSESLTQARELWQQLMVEQGMENLSL